MLRSFERKLASYLHMFFLGYYGYWNKIIYNDLILNNHAFKMPFLTELNVHPIPLSNKRKLTDDFAYKRDNGRVILVEKGFITDYASIPKIIPQWIISGDDPIIREGAVIHDYLYKTYKYPREECDEVLIEIMDELGASIPMQILVFISVRLFGGLHW